MAPVAARKARRGDTAQPEGRLAARSRVAQTFDLAAFKAEWRGLCRLAQVDPIAGATSFQAADWQARQATLTHEERMAARVRDHAARHPELFEGRAAGVDGRASTDWWRDPELWRRPGEAASIVEEAAIDAVFRDAGGSHMAQVGRLAATIQRQTRPVRQGYDGSELKPLREHLAERGEQLSFVELGRGGTLSFVIPAQQG